VGDSAADELEIGDVVSALFPSHDPVGREQEGHRPAVVVGIPELLGVPRFGVLLCAPMTSDRGQPWAQQALGLYPRYKAGTAGLRSASICLLDQVRALSVERVSRYRGTLSNEEYEPIRVGLARMMGFSEEDEDGDEPE
jgi:mRNA interferase MazF